MNVENDLKIIEARHKLSVKYCKEKGWDMANLSFEQVMEIRKLPEWKTPEGIN